MSNDRTYFSKKMLSIQLFRCEIPLIVTRRVETMYYIEGYHLYKALWIPITGECLLSQQEPDNPEDKYAVYVEKENKDICHLEDWVNLLKQFSIS